MADLNYEFNGDVISTAIERQRWRETGMRCAIIQHP